MKHKILIGSLIVTLFAFILYTSNIKRVENAQLKIVEPNNSKVAKNKKKTKEPKVKKLEKPKEPKVNSIEYSNHVKAQKGSNQKLVKQIKKVMGIDDSFQVVAQDLTNSSHFAVVSNTNKAHDAGKTMRLFLLIALYEQEQKDKMGSRTAIKISKKDKAKGDKMFQVGITYGVSYLRSAMLKGNKTAASALTRKIGVNNIDQVAKKMGATQTKVNSNMAGQTTANDLAKTMIGLYQGRVLNRQYASRVLATLAKERPSLVSGLSGGIYAIGDDDFAVAIVQTNGRAYCMSVWSTQHKNFNKLGKTVNAWFIKKHK
ncbi:serine hydrolase [Lactobacillus crispatus]|uniref:Serine hydrolase n=1 Tax=Lactobacillus crispatus TaxID=47770 RepID=A0AAW6XJQ5_9LACO|nr:serine hydrolase [Lactobacillus crispatus]MDK6502243.1 serine hydrolase [Lactobacillus crispatus]PLA30394.1 serine hydrolase [Lactobacillus crispatus]